MNNYIMVSSPTVQSDLTTKTDYIVYIPLATDKTYGSVKVGEGLKIDYGVISLDRTEIPILSISKNGEPLFPDEFKNVNIPLTKKDVGLSEVDNTSDEDKPVSTLQQIEFDKKLNIHQGVELQNMTLYVNDNGDISFRKQSNDLIVKENDKTIISDASALRFNNFFTVKSVGKEVVIDGSEKLTSFFKTVEYDSGTGVLSFTRYNGEILKIDLPLELIVESGYYNEDSQQIVLILANGGVIEIPVSSLLDDFYSKNEIDSLFAQQEHVAIGDIPDASENVLGKVVLYVGETNDKYVKGDLYKCVSWTNYAIEPAETSYYWVDLNNSLYIMPETAHGYEGRIVRYIGETNEKYTYGKFYEYYDTGISGSFGGEFRESEIYATKEMVDAKQDKLTAGENISIDENNVISATVSAASKETLGVVRVWIEDDYLCLSTDKYVRYHKVLSDNTPQQIADISAEISENNYTAEEVSNIYGWNIGDSIPITLTTGEQIEVRIIGINHDAKTDGSGKAGLTLQMVDCLNTLYPMGTSGTNKGGYNASILKTTHLPTIKSTLPEEWQKVIKPVNKKYADGGSSANYVGIKTISADIFLLSEYEVLGKVVRAQAGASEGNLYKYYEINSNASDRIKNSKNTATNWWLRSCDSTYSAYFCSIDATGESVHTHATGNYGVSFAFCV